MANILIDIVQRLVHKDNNISGCRVWGSVCQVPCAVNVHSVDGS